MSESAAGKHTLAHDPTEHSSQIIFFFAEDIFLRIPIPVVMGGEETFVKRNVDKLNGNLAAYISTYSLFSPIQLVICSLNCMFLSLQLYGTGLLLQISRLPDDLSM